MRVRYYVWSSRLGGYAGSEWSVTAAHASPVTASAASIPRWWPPRSVIHSSPPRRSRSTVMPAPRTGESFARELGIAAGFEPRDIGGR